MIQAIGLTSTPRTESRTRTRWWLRAGHPDGEQEGRPRPVLDDVSLEASPGRVTALLGTPVAGTTAVRLMLGIEQGRGITYFRGRTLDRIVHPLREVGALLGDVPGHPRRTVRGHLRLLCAASGLPAERADDVLEAMGLASLRGERVGTLSRGLDRRLGMACALLPDPHVLLLDAPAAGLAAREQRWLHGLLRAHAEHGGTVLFTTGDPGEAARVADRVVALKNGRVVADQEAQDFARTRLRPRTVVRSPHAARLGMLLTREARAARRTVEVVEDGINGNRLSVYGSSCPEIGDTAFRHGIPVHQLTDETGDMGPAPGPLPAPRPVGVTAVTTSVPSSVAHATRSGTPCPSGPTAEAGDTRLLPAPASSSSSSPFVRARPSLPPPLASSAPERLLLAPLRYELRRAAGVPMWWLTAGGIVAVSVLAGLFLAVAGRAQGPQALAVWPRELPLYAAALGSGLLGALASGDEARHPVRGTGRVSTRWLELLAARLLVAALTGVLLALSALGGGTLLPHVLHWINGFGAAPVPVGRPAPAVQCLLLAVGCAWAGALVAGASRSAVVGFAGALAVPFVAVPLLHGAWAGPAVREAGGAGGASARLPGLAPSPGTWGTPSGGAGPGVMQMVTQPVGTALALSLVALFCAFLFLRFRDKAR